MSETKAAVLIDIHDLHKSFGTQVVLDGVDLHVNAGESVAVLGRSGTGKSVLLKLIMGLLPCDGGSIKVHEQEIVGLADIDKLNETRKKVGFLFQQGALYDSLTIQGNVEFPLARHTKMSQQERADKARKLLVDVGMDGHFDKLPSQISGGMQKRVGLARALALDPGVVLFDEPTAGLDPITASEIDDLIVKLREERKMSSLVVTHDIHGARVFSDRMILMREGKIVAEGTAQDLEKNQDPFVKQFLSNGESGGKNDGSKHV